MTPCFILFFQRLQRCLRALGFDVIGHIMADVSNLCQVIIASLALEAFYGKSSSFLSLRLYCKCNI